MRNELRGTRGSAAVCTDSSFLVPRSSLLSASIFYSGTAHNLGFLGIREIVMPYVITEACINTKDKACVDVCPVDCIYEGPEQLYIHPDECIDCGACEPECPVTAIFPEEDVPANLKQYVQLNRDVFKSAAPPGKPTR